MEKKYPDVVDFMQFVFKENDLHFSYSYSSVKIGDLISEKEIIKMLSIKNLESSSVQKFFGVLAKKDIRFEIIYESIYGEKWKIINDGKPPVKIE